MILRELCQLLNISESTILTNFPRTRDRLLDRGIRVDKDGRGKYAEYEVEEFVPGAVRRYKYRKKGRLKKDIFND